MPASAYFVITFLTWEIEMKKTANAKTAAKTAMESAAAALTGSKVEGKTKPETATKPEAKAEPPKEKRDIFNDIKSNDHLRKKLWSCKGPIHMLLMDTRGHVYKVGINKSDVVNILQIDNATLLAPPYFHLEVNPGINQGGTLMTRAPKEVKSAVTETSAAKNESKAETKVLEEAPM